MRTRSPLAILGIIAIMGCQEAADVAHWDQPPEAPAVRETLPVAGPAPTAAPPNTVLFVSDEYSDETPPPHESSFPLLDVGNLYFYAYFEDLAPGDHVARLDVYNPDGYRYTTLSAPFEVPEEVMAPLGTRVLFELPVAGTHISQYFLTGVWSARALLDVVAGRPEAETTFELYWAPEPG